MHLTWIGIKRKREKELDQPCNCRNDWQLIHKAIENEPPHSGPPPSPLQQHLPSRGATFYRGIPRGVTQATPTTTAAAVAHRHHAHHTSLEEQLRELDEELLSHSHVDHVESNSLQVRMHN